MQSGPRVENPLARVARVAGASAYEVATDGDAQADKYDDDDDEFGPDAGRDAPDPQDDAELDDGRASKGEAWDAFVVKTLKKCPLH